MKRYISGLLLILIIGLANIGYAQATYKIQDNTDIDMKLNGTSTLHDWQMDAKSAVGEAQFIFKSANANELTSLKSLTFNLAVKI